MTSYTRRQQSSEPPVIDEEILNLDRSINILDFLNVADCNTVRTKGSFVCKHSTYFATGRSSRV